METKVKIRSCERDSFWSAGRKWVREGTIVTLVDDDIVPDRFFRPTFERHDFKREHPIGKELDFPMVDSEYQAWLMVNRQRHAQRGELTLSEYNQVLADARFLAVEHPTPVMPERSQPAQQATQQAQPAQQGQKR